MKKSLIVTLFVTLLVTTILSANASAHPFTTPCPSQSELYGYVVDCSNHQPDTSFTYNVPTTLSAAYLGYIATGATRWNNTNKVSITKSPFLDQFFGYIHTYADPDADTNALFYGYSSDSIGHLNEWRIKFNTSKMDSRTSAQNQATAAHELGHAIGLNDLKLASNINKLMYKSADRTVTSPSDKDILGAVEATRN